MAKDRIPEERDGRVVGGLPESGTERTNALKAKIDKSQKSSLCRLCLQKSKMVDHILSECPKITHTQLKLRHDTGAKAGPMLGPLLSL